MCLVASVTFSNADNKQAPCLQNPNPEPFKGKGNALQTQRDETKRTDLVKDKMEKKSFQNRAYVRLNLKDQNMNNLVVEVAVMYLIWLTYTREEKS